jgi:hypothetical protein
MLARVCAFCLVGLILTPVSAPFSTCDVSMLLLTSEESRRVPTETVMPSTAVADLSTAHALPSARVTGRLEFLPLSAYGSYSVAVPVDVRRAHATLLALQGSSSAFSAPLRI